MSEEGGQYGGKRQGALEEERRDGKMWFGIDPGTADMLWFDRKANRWLRRTWRKGNERL